MAYLAVSAHQSFAELKQLSTFEIDLFVDHVSMLIEMQNEETEAQMKQASEE